MDWGQQFLEMIALDNQEMPRIVYRKNGVNGMFHAYQLGADTYSWSNESANQDSHYGEDLEVDVDPQGNSHIVYIVKTIWQNGLIFYIRNKILQEHGLRLK